MSVDPMAHLYPGWTPYHYVLNNPLSFIDPDGRLVTNPPLGPGYYAASVRTREVGFAARNPDQLKKLGIELKLVTSVHGNTLN